ncbi:MAG: GPR endopeptidase [Ruminococcaceae bacterium]|nr:GPR endopeptidase [Oscillospiraceae bacterium]
MELRTDLAVEEHESYCEDLKGVDYTSEEVKGLFIERLCIKTSRAGQLLHKDAGRYVTITLPPLTDNMRDTDERVQVIAEEIRRLLPVNGTVLVAGLGNREITPDALGPKSIDRVLATRHISGEIARSTGLDRLRSVATLSAGVTGQTGIETGELVLSVVNKIKPTAVVVVDALASRKLARLGCTLQISDTGISPGAGVGNHRTKLSKETLGVPVIALGVPTVVDALTLLCDLVCSEDEYSQQSLKEQVSPRGREMVVTPREVDLLVDRAAKLIALSVNMALHSGIETEELLALI